LSAVVWKHPLRMAVLNRLDLPLGATVLTVDNQPGVGLCLWEAHDPEQTKTEQRTFRIVGTGHVEDFAPGLHVGTVLVEGGLYVWHVFEEPE
jgi:hypothetical protein